MDPKNDTSQAASPTHPSCDGQGLKQMAAAGLAWLDQNHEQVNALNVFPVPDGDTGTNMLLTMRSAYKEIANLTETHVGRIATKLYNGALMGARGNSGVILSQLWRGFARGIEQNDILDGQSLARGLQEATRTAYQAVQEPVEGTILTVAREAAEEAVQAATNNPDLHYVMERVVARSHDAVKRTPELLDVLREAGVVDSGGMGLAYILEGMLHNLQGDELIVTTEVETMQHLQSALDPGELGYGYDVQFLLKGQELDVAQIRSDITAMGDSTLVVGDSNTIKVHVHVHNPGVPLSYGAERGILDDIVVENMQAQYQEFVLERGGPSMYSQTPDIKPPEVVEGNIAAIAVSPGDGLQRIFFSLGAAQVVSGGQTMNPSTEELVEAIKQVPTDKLIILPNNKNIQMAAEAAAQLVEGKQARVVPSKTIPQGIAALLALDPEGDLEAVRAAMEDALQDVETGEVTIATRDTTVNGLEVRRDQVIGLHNDVLCVAGDDIPSVVFDLLRHMKAEQLELITLYYGIDVNPRDAETLAEALIDEYPDQEIEVREGGQAYYFYILSAE